LPAKSQHTIPRLHLQHFVGPEPAGQVWTYDAISGKRWSRVPEETCVQTHFYSAERSDGATDTRLEEFLSQVESRAAPVYEALLKKRLPRDQARADFAQFLALMHCRTTTMRRMAAKSVAEALRLLPMHTQVIQNLLKRSLEALKLKTERRLILR
jgi:Protein of unknown function (DUF4238)